jgi:hypothetical protein
MLISGALAGDGNDGNVRLPKTLGIKPPLTVFRPQEMALVMETRTAMEISSETVGSSTFFF